MVPNGRVVTVPVVGGVVVVVVVLERSGFQMLKFQKLERVIGADSGPDNIKVNRLSFRIQKIYVPQNSVPLATPKKQTNSKNTKISF